MTPVICVYRCTLHATSGTPDSVFPGGASDHTLERPAHPQGEEGIDSIWWRSRDQFTQFAVAHRLVFIAVLEIRNKLPAKSMILLGQNLFNLKFEYQHSIHFPCKCIQNKNVATE